MQTNNYIRVSVKHPSEVVHNTVIARARTHAVGTFFFDSRDEQARRVALTKALGAAGDHALRYPEEPAPTLSIWAPIPELSVNIIGP